MSLWIADMRTDGEKMNWIRNIFRRKTQEEKCAEGQHCWVFLKEFEIPYPHPKFAAEGCIKRMSRFVCRNPKCDAQEDEPCS